MDIYSFWEPADSMPAYLKLCMKTWEKFLPDAKIHLINFSNINDYIDISVYGEKLFDGAFSLPQITDVLRAGLLEKHGGVWMDVDTIILSKEAEKFFYCDKDARFFGYPDKPSVHVAWILAKQNSKFMKYWVEQNIKKINEFKDGGNYWSYFSNSIINPYIEENFSEIDIVDVKKENGMPENIVGKKTGYANYLEFYFLRDFHVSDINSSIVFLHNSGTPEPFLKMSENEFFNYKCTMSNILKELLH